MWDFAHGRRRSELRKQFDVEYTIPSHCAQMLAEGSADIGIIPVAAHTVIPGLRIIPNVAIASRNAVKSILLVSTRPQDQIRTVAVDTSSRSSAALIQVLFAKHWKREVQFSPADPEIGNMLQSHDSALLIGDPALQIDRSRYLTWDLAEEWRKFSGKPFVFAFWAVRGGAAEEEGLAQVSEVFNQSRDAGVRHIEAIADEWTERLELSRELIVAYLSENIQYDLDQESITGMQLFFRYASELNVLPAARELRFAGELETRNSALINRV